MVKVIVVDGVERLVGPCKHCNERGKTDHPCCRVYSGFPENQGVYNVKCCSCDGAGWKVVKV